MKFKTFWELYSYLDRLNVEKHFNYRKNDQWQTLSTRDFIARVKYLALALHASGLKSGESVGLIAKPSPFWLMADMAIILAGGITVPIFTRISPENLSFELEDSEIRFIFIGKEEELAAVQEKGKKIKKIFTIEIDAEGKSLESMDELLALGKKLDEEDSRLFLTLSSGISEDDLFSVIYTSGSTGIPKGVQLTHKNILSQVDAAEQFFPLDRERDLLLTSLPFAHIFERMVIYYYLTTGCPVYFVDDLNRIGDIIKEVRPTVMTVVPRLLDKVYAKMKSMVEKNRGFKKWIGMKAIQRAETKAIGEKMGFADGLYAKLVYSKLIVGLGGRFRMIISGGAPLSPDVNRFFLNIGVPIYEGYGLTEGSPVLAANCPGHRKSGTVGKSFPGVILKISEEGEILARGPNIMLGYRNNKEETELALKDDWLHTGDLGKIDEDGYLSITGRKKELFKKSTGEYVSPVPIEQKLAAHPLIDMAIVIAESQKFVSVLLVPDFENLGSLKAKYNLTQLSDQDFLADPGVLKDVQLFIKEMNKHLHYTENIQKFRFIPRPLTVEAGELTPTMKIRRHIVEEKYRDLIDSIYHLEREEDA